MGTSARLAVRGKNPALRAEQMRARVGLNEQISWLMKLREGGLITTKFPACIHTTLARHIRCAAERDRDRPRKPPTAWQTDGGE